MKNKFRTIVVNNLKFQWNYQCRVNHLPPLTSRLYGFNKEENIQIDIFFHTYETQTGGNPLNEGLPMEKNRETHYVNVNQPGYVSELFKLVLDRHITENSGRFVFQNGNSLLHELEYREKGFCFLRE